jgi:hypothetical protein
LALNISAPFAISGLSITKKYSFDLLMTQTKPQLLTLRKHPVSTLQCPNFRIVKDIRIDEGLFDWARSLRRSHHLSFCS